MKNNNIASVVSGCGLAVWIMALCIANFKDKEAEEVIKLEKPLLTSNDLKDIEQGINGFYFSKSSELFIKLTNGEYLKVYSDYYLYSKDGESLELTYNKDNIKNVVYLGTLKEFIIENEIEVLEYKMTDIPNANERYILNNYGEKVFRFLEEEGYPILCFDINDLYESYENQKEDILRLGREK